jgi:lipopolysaccharide transport system ATP-binding protein
VSTSRQDPAVALAGVWRRYPTVPVRRPRGVRAAISRDPLRRDRERSRWALRGVDLQVAPGEAVALVGRNGAGKSTLLRLVGGIGRAERGSVRVQGRIGALIDLGHEFHGELTGWQNAEVAAVVAGLTRREFRDRAGSILEFAELEDAADEPLRAYSDGMRARLAFSVMAHLEPRVLLVDEVLAVGDAAFQRRSVERIGKLRDAGAAVLFVSHDLGLVRRVCDRAAWLELGEVRRDGPSAQVVEAYLREVTGDRVDDHGAVRSTGVITAAHVLDQWGAPLAELVPGDGMEVRVELALPDAHPRARLRVRVLHADRGTALVDTSTPVHHDGAASMTVRFDRLDLAPGRHRVEIGLYRDDWSALIDEVHAATVNVRGTGPDSAPLAPPHEWRPG